MRNANTTSTNQKNSRFMIPVPTKRFLNIGTIAFLVALLAGYCFNGYALAQKDQSPPPSQSSANSSTNLLVATPPTEDMTTKFEAMHAKLTDSAPARTQSVPLPVVSSVPSQLSAAATHGEIIVRTLTLRSSQALAQTQLTIPDIPGAEMRTILPANSILPLKPFPIEVPAEKFVSIPLKINLQDVPSGQYTGQVFLSYADGFTAIPVSVSVKDSPMWPLLLLILGVITGLGLSVYRAQGQPHDETIVQTGRLYQLSQSDRQLPPSFQNSLHDLLYDADTQIKSAQWDAAKLDAAQAQTVWDKWSKNRTDWLAQIAYLGDLEAKIGSLPQASGNYLSGLLETVQQISQNAANDDSPLVLATASAPAATALKQYLHVQADLAVMDNQRREWPTDSDESAQYARQIEDFHQELDRCDASDAAGTEAVRVKIKTAMEAMKLPTSTASFKAMSFGNKSFLEPSLPITDDANLPLPPEAGLDPHKKFNLTVSGRAQSRLKAMQWMSYSLVVLLLAGSGFGDLYMAKPTFGANGWGDYFGLIAWGLGAHAASVAAGNWLGNLPGVKSATPANP